MLPFTSLNAVTSAGSGASRDLEMSLEHHTALLRVTGSPTSAVIDIEGSHDGSTWIVVATVNVGNPTDPYQTALNVDQVLRHIRATVKTLSGGTSPTVTATIASA